MLIYILIRLFTRKRKYIEGDELRHMACAKDFYKLWNKSFYDTHPPFYSFLIKIFSGVTKRIGHYRAGVIVSFLCSIGLFIICGRLYDLLGLSPTQKSVALACLTFNYTLIYYSNKAFRYQLIALLGTSVLYTSLTGNYIVSGILWGLLGLTCAYAGLRGFWIWLLAGFNFGSLFIFSVFYGSWLYKKWKVYTSNKYYPAGIDGKIEPMEKLNFKKLLSPLYFPWTYSYYGSKELGYDFKGWFKKIGGMYGFYQTEHRKVNVLLYILTGLAMIITVKGMLSAPFPLVVLTLILLYPSLFKRFLPRNSIMAIPLICYFMGLGIGQMTTQWLLYPIILGVVAFLYFHHTSLLANPKIKATVTSRIINRLGGDGVLVEGLIAYPIAYQTHKRVVVIPHNPNPTLANYLIKLSIKEFKLKYIVISDLWKTEEHLGYPAIKYIKENYPLIRMIREDNDTYNIYEIPVNITA